MKEERKQTMKPIYQEFQDDMMLVDEVKQLINQGVSQENLYVISHDDDRTSRIANKIDVNEIGIEEEGIKAAVKNIFQKKGDELRAKFVEVGFSKEEASVLEEKLDHGKILLLIMDENSNIH